MPRRDNADNPAKTISQTDCLKMERAMKKFIEKAPAKDISAYGDWFSLVQHWETLDFDAAHASNKELRSAIYHALRLCAQNGAPAEVAREYDILCKSSLRFDARHEFDAFLRYVEIDSRPERQFYAPRAGYLRQIVQGYQDILDHKLHFLSISLPKRAGKAVTLDTELVTPTGTIRMGDVEVGTELIGSDGLPCQVKDVYPQGIVPVYDVKFSDGIRIKTCGNHLWKVTDTTSGEESLKTTSEILDGISKEGKSFSVEHCKPVEYRQQDVPIDPYVLGVLLSDGRFANGVLKINAYGEIIKNVKSRMPEGTLENLYEHNENGRYCAARYFVNKDSSLYRNFSKIAAISGKPSERYIPEVYLYNSASVRLDVLRGLLDTNGYNTQDTQNQIEYLTDSQMLRDNVAFVVRSLGGKSGYIELTREEGSIEYQVNIQLPNGIMPFLITRKAVLYNHTQEKLYHHIESITPCGNDYAQCIEVDNQSHMYLLADHFIPTHNSTLGILFTCMLSGLHPEKSTLMEGTGDALVGSFYNGLLEYLNTDTEYLFYEIFPEVLPQKGRLITNADTRIINLGSRSRFPTIMCRSIDAQQVGLSEATNALYLDDCVAGREEAMNRDRMEDKWTKLSGDVLGRALEGTPIIATGTRYSVNDPIGKLQEVAMSQKWTWRAIEIPALNSKDESNYEYFDPKIGSKVFTTKFFIEQREMLSAEQWESEFMQQPFEAKGLLFNRKDLIYFDCLPVDKEPDTVLAVCDTAESGSDSTAMVILKVYGEEVYVDDVVFDNSAAIYVIPQCAKKLVEHKVSKAIFESNSGGAYFARDVADATRSLGGRLSVITRRSISNKNTRIEVSSNYIIKHFHFWSWSVLAGECYGEDAKEAYKRLGGRGGQYWAFMRELTSYVRSGKVSHDDAPDALSLAENELRSILMRAEIPIFMRPC